MDVKVVKKKKEQEEEPPGWLLSLVAAVSPAPALDGRGGGGSRNRGGSFLPSFLPSAVEKQKKGRFKKRLRVILFSWRRRLQQAKFTG